LFESVLPAQDDESFACLRFVDRYGDTVFNQLQAPTVISELQRVRATAPQSLNRFLADVEQLARRVADIPGHHLRFVGD
jgi:ABC-type iron transport system FetAB ATPase subunit